MTLLPIGSRGWSGFSAFLAALLVSSSAMAETHRTAVIVGAENGGTGSRPLHYAYTDATRIRDILTSIGGFAPEDTILLQQPTADGVRHALADADKRANGGLLFFYYSGHARDGSLRLGDSTLPLDELRSRLAGLSASTRIAVLDSCRSGEFIRSKGGRIAPAFSVADEATGPRGLALLASSAADEDSQESDLLGASFFTHYFASGLVGDADTNGDGRVSLQEAYEYAYGRTVAQTAEAGAVQHPTYQYRLSGAGDLWLTDVARARATLVLGPGPSGAYVIVDATRRTLVAEVEKPEGAARRIALPPGKYEVKRQQGDGALFARVDLGNNETVTLDDGAMTHVASARNLSKGQDWAGALATVRPGRWTISATGSGQMFFAGATRTGMFPNMPMGGVEVDARDLWDSPHSIIGLDASAGGGSLGVNVGSAAFPTQMTEWTAGLSYMYEPWPGWIRPYFGARLSVVGVSRTFSEGGVPEQGLFTMAPGVVAGVNFDLVRHLSLGVQARASYLLYQSDDNLSLGYADAGLLLRWEL